MDKVKVVQRQGLINEEGKVIVPLKYESVQILKCGIYVAKVSTVELEEEEKPVRSQYYHHKKLTPVKDQSVFHLYTDKGRIAFNEPIMGYICNIDDGEKIIAIGVEEGWRLVEFNYEKNFFKSYYSIANEVCDVSSECVAVKRLNKGCTVYSLKDWEKIIDTDEADRIHMVPGKGFKVYEESGKIGFYNSAGYIILDNEWDVLEFRDDYIKVIEYHSGLDKIKRKGKYSYNGEVIMMEEYNN